MDQGRPLTQEEKEILYAQKMILMFESAPLSDNFEQIMLSPTQMRAVIQFTQGMMPKDPWGGFWIKTNDKFKATFKDIPICYEESELTHP